VQLFWLRVIRKRIEDTPGETIFSGNAWGSSAAGITAQVKDSTTRFSLNLRSLLYRICLPQNVEIEVSGVHRCRSLGDDTNTYK